MVIGKRMRKLREGKGLSQGEIEQRAGLLRGYISRVENGHTIPALETLERFADELGIPLYQLFYEGDESATPVPDLTPGRALEDDEGNREKHFKRVRQLLEKKSRASDDADLVFGTLAKVFSKL